MKHYVREHIFFVDYINMCSYWLASGVSAKEFNLVEKRINVTVPASFWDSSQTDRGHGFETLRV